MTTFKDELEKILKEAIVGEGFVSFNANGQATFDRAFQAIIELVDRETERFKTSYEHKVEDLMRETAIVSAVQAWTVRTPKGTANRHIGEFGGGYDQAQADVATLIAEQRQKLNNLFGKDK